MMVDSQGAPIRVVINGLHAKSGGGLTYLRNMLPALAEDRALELHLFLHKSQHGLIAPHDSIRIHLFDFSDRVLNLLLWEQLVMPFLAHFMGADVLFSPSNYGALAAKNQAILLGNALAVGTRETRIRKRIYWSVLSAMTAASLLRARRAIAVSHYAKGALTFGLAKFLSDSVVVIHHGVSKSFYPVCDGSERDSFILAVGDIYIQKNYHMLLRTMVRLRDRFPGIVLKIAGANVDPEYGEQLRKFVSQHELGSNVRFLGSVDTASLRELYSRCKLFVFPSTVETFGMPLIEAMACGAPIACSRAAAIPEIAGTATKFFDPDEEEDMRRVIGDLLDSDETRKDLAQRGSNRARDFSWETAARATAALLKSIAPRLHPRPR